MSIDPVSPTQPIFPRQGPRRDRKQSGHEESGEQPDLHRHHDHDTHGPPPEHADRPPKAENPHVDLLV
jgi:hypothetical protein